MFLDDELYQHFKSRRINNANDANVMLNELFVICDAHKRRTLDPSNQPSAQVIKAEIDRIFKSWDSFIRMLEKDQEIFVPIYKEFSYKYVWMQDPKLKEIYYSL